MNTSPAGTLGTTHVDPAASVAPDHHDSHDGAVDPTENGEPVRRIESAVLALLRQANDPRGNDKIYERAGSDIERAGSVMLARIEELQPARLSDLATAAGVKVSTASRQVARLVEQGYVTRTVDPLDARASLHRLTPAGRGLRGRLRRAVTSFFEEALTDLNEHETELLANLLSRFVDGLLGGRTR
ncbi:MAG: MarR family winged helix-turn-helix transcriptional regulator [Microthrixaceae bacterium]